jgi:thioredoxin-dependent peroxiredoxin
MAIPDNCFSHRVFESKGAKMRVKQAIQQIAAIAMMCTGLYAATPTMPAVGETAPDFTLPSQDGSEVSLKDFRGKYVVLYFYPKDGTQGCTLEAHNFQRDLPKYEALKAVIVGVSVDTTGSHKQFCTQQGLTFKLLADTSRKVVQEYGSERPMTGPSLAARNTFLVDPQGKVVKRWTEVNSANHSEQVLEALSQVAQK